MQLVVTLLFPLLFLAPFALASCPSQESVSPCECEDVEDSQEGDYVDLICYGKSITLDQVKIALQALDRNDPVSLLLDEMNLGTIPSNVFQGFNIWKLEMSHCELDSLSEGGGKPLTGLEDTLKELDIVTSFTENSGPTKLDLGHLKRLRNLDLSYNAITELGNDWFTGGHASLKNIMFSNNNIKKVGDKIFANVNNLEELHFDGNRFGDLRRSMLPNPASKLQELELDNNDLTSLPEDLFTNMPALVLLKARTNRLTKISEQTFKSIWDQLVIVDLRGNPIICDSHLDWIAKLKSNTHVLGRCHSPDEQRGVELDDFIRGRL